jgi:hypothetical protein
MASCQNVRLTPNQAGWSTVAMRPRTARPMAVAGIPLLLAGTAACAATTPTAASAARASCPGPAASLRLDGAVYGVASADGGGAWTVGWAGAREKDLIARWDGTAWRRVPAPRLGGSSTGLDGVAAASARSAWAVGYENGSTPLILHWDGTAWRRTPVPHLPLSSLRGTAAVTPADAWAVGNTGTGPEALILHWDGRAWQRAPSPDPGGHSALAAVAATSPRDAWAVGHTGAFPVAQPARILILHWDGTAWSRAPSPGPPGNSTLTGVTAISPADAWAVGFTGTIEGRQSRALILHWDGMAWRQVPAPTIPGGGALNAVSAYSPGDIWAVGEAGPVTPQKLSTLILHWDGRRWSRLPGPAGFLDAVTATSSRSAWAVGISAPDRTATLHCTTQG